MIDANKGVIYCSEDVYDKLETSLNKDIQGLVNFSHGVTFKKSPFMECGTMITEDPALVVILKQLDVEL